MNESPSVENGSLDSDILDVVTVNAAGAPPDPTRFTEPSPVPKPTLRMHSRTKSLNGEELKTNSSTNDIPTIDISANDISTNEISTNEISTNEISTNEISADDSATNDSSTNDIIKRLQNEINEESEQSLTIQAIPPFDFSRVQESCNSSVILEENKSDPPRKRGPGRPR